jgi:hypothetical protein
MTVMSLLRRGALWAFCLGSLAAPEYAAAEALPTHVLASIAEREYHASFQADKLQAPNRAQRFRTRFHEDGIELVERDPSAQPLLQLRLTQWGRVDQPQPAEPGVLVANEARVERRSSGLTEWYINRPEGLEHGFDLAFSPPGRGVLEFRLQSDRPAHQVHADLIEFGSGDDTLRYSTLKVWDASGRILPAQMEVSGARRVVIRVDDAGAQYPVTIDPLLQRTADIVRNSGQSGAEFGIRIANAGDVNNDGIDDLVVGAFRFDSSGLSDNGGAFVYLGPGFTTSAFLSTNQASAGFGAGVGGAGDLNLDGFDDVVIGAPGFDGTAGIDSGAVYVYFGGAGAFDATADATVLGPNARANMGAAARGVGDVNNDGIDDLAVGVPRYNPGGRPDQGAAFIYYGASNFNTTADAVLTTNDASVNSGNSLASGDVNGDGINDVIVGATGYESSSSFINEGAAVVFFGGVGTIDTTADAILRTGRADATGGASVAVGDFNGDGIGDVLSGAPPSSTAITEGGMVQIWHGSTGSFDTLVDVTFFGTDIAENFGRSVAALPDSNGDGRDEIVVGAPRANNSGGLSTGEVKLYFSAANGFSSSPSLVLEGTETDALFGNSVAIGRFNSDAFFDVSAGEPSRDISPGVNNGAFHLYFGQSIEVFKDGFE